MIKSSVHVAADLLLNRLYASESTRANFFDPILTTVISKFRAGNEFDSSVPEDTIQFHGSHTHMTLQESLTNDKR